MGEIKSALELALERTKDIKSDPEGLRRHEARETGKRLYAKLVENPDFNLKKALKDVPKDQQSWVREGLFSVVQSNLTLPQSEDDLDRLTTIEQALHELVSDRGVMKELMGQVRQFFRQYLEDRTELTENVRRQYEPRIKQKEQQLSQQYGRRVKLDPASDPEFSRVLQDHIGRLDEQYREALGQVTEHLKGMFRP
jgi:hypothetical protein